MHQLLWFVYNIKCIHIIRRTLHLTQLTPFNTAPSILRLKVLTNKVHADYDLSFLSEQIYSIDIEKQCSFPYQKCAKNQWYKKTTSKSIPPLKLYDTTDRHIHI